MDVRRFLTTAAAAMLMTVLPVGVALAQEYPPGTEEPTVLPTIVERPTGGATPTEEAVEPEVEVLGVTLSRTGANAALLGALGLGAVALGGGAVAVARRRSG